MAWAVVSTTGTWHKTHFTVAVTRWIAAALKRNYSVCILSREWRVAPPPPTRFSANFSSGWDLSLFAMPNVVSYKIALNLYLSSPNINCIILRNLQKRSNGCINKNVSDSVYFTVVLFFSSFAAECSCRASVFKSFNAMVCREIF